MNRDLLQTTVLSDLGRHIRDITHDNDQLREINSELRQQLQGQSCPEMSEVHLQKDWLETALRATQADNLELTTKCVRRSYPLSDRSFYPNLALLPRSVCPYRADAMQASPRSGKRH